MPMDGFEDNCGTIDAGACFEPVEYRCRESSDGERAKDCRVRAGDDGLVVTEALEACEPLSRCGTRLVIDKEPGTFCNFGITGANILDDADSALRLREVVVDEIEERLDAPLVLSGRDKGTTPDEERCGSRIPLGCGLNATPGCTRYG